MKAYVSQIDPGSEAFGAQREDMLALVARLRELEARATALSERRRARFEQRGQLTPRERLQRLLDPGMPFVELHNMANYLVEDTNPETSVPGASVLAGIGFVAGTRCLVWVDDSGIKAGSMTQSTLPKTLSILEVARRQKLPLVHLVESAGANLMAFQVESWVHAGGVFYRLAKLSAEGVPTLVVLHGPSTAGGAYMPGMSDYVVGVKNNGMAALGGAALVRAATGEVADEAQLGGAEMHASTTGSVEYLAEDDAEGIAIVRDVVERLHWNDRCERPPARGFDEPLYSPDELAGVVPVDPKKAYDVREVLARIVDGSRFQEFKERYGPSTVCVHAEVYGMPCGIIGNNGPIDPAGATKATHFFQLCDQSEMPLVFLHNTTGYMVGTEYEQAGMIKHGSKMIQATSNVRVPRISFYIGASYGAGNYGMCGFAYEPDLLFAWPNSHSHVMGGEQAALTMAQVMEIAAERRGQPVDRAALDAEIEGIKAHFEPQTSVFYTSGRCLDHGVIDPRDTRRVLGFALETCWEARHRDVQPNSFGVARM